MSKEKQLLGDLVKLSQFIFELEDKYGRDELNDFIHAGRESWGCTDEEIVSKLIVWNDGIYNS